MVKEKGERVGEENNFWTSDKREMLSVKVDVVEPFGWWSISVGDSFQRRHICR